MTNTGETGEPTTVPDHAVTGVAYVPVCDECWQPVHLTEADDGTFEHS